MWTPVGTLPASAWARRMAHETAVHRADGQITAGQEPVIDADIAADGTDEWLMIVSGQDYADMAGHAHVLAGGRVLHIHATDTAPGTGEWLVSADSGGLTVTRGHGKGDVAARGPAWALLLMLVRRLPPDSPHLEIIGDRLLLGAWLTETPF
jgi:hypothetical protein